MNKIVAAAFSVMITNQCRPDMMSRAILVTGATGNQGGALIRALLRADGELQILALTRDTKSPSAKRLEQLSPNIKLINGDLDHPHQIFQKAREVSKQDVWGVYSVQVAIQNPNEKKQGLSLIEAAVAHDVQHFVYSSVDRGGPKSPENPTQIPHFQIKHEIENQLLESTEDGKMSYTILRPVAFYENLTPDFIGKIFATSWSIYLPREKKLQLVAASDIGAIGAQAFLEQETYRNKAVTIVGDELTYTEFKKVFEENLKIVLPTTFPLLARLLNWAMKDLGEMFRWFATEGYDGDIEACRRMKGGEMVSFGTWLTQMSRSRK